MIDIDVEGSRRYGVIESGSRAHKALLKLRSVLITARLSSEDGSRPHASAETVSRIMGFKQTVAYLELSHLVRIGVLDPVFPFDVNELYPHTYWSREGYSYMGKMSSQEGFCLGPQALAAITDLRNGADIVRFPFP